MSRRAVQLWISPERVLCAALLLTACITGCTPVEKIPTYSARSTQDELKVLAERSRQVRTISSQALVTLTSPGGETVNFDAAIVIQPPDNARVRAYKFGQAVFDLTSTSKGLWLLSASDSHKEQIESAGASAGRFVRQWQSLLTGAFDAEHVSAEDRGTTLIVRQPQEDGSATVAQIDRRTLTPRRYAVVDSAGRERFVLSLDRYAETGGIVWPMRLRGTSESGSLQIELHDLELNSELPASAFRPPARARKLQ